MRRGKKQAVKGQTLKSPRLTRAGLRMLLFYVALPLVLVLGLIDFAFYLYFRFALDRCYGIWCWL